MNRPRLVSTVVTLALFSGLSAMVALAQAPEPPAEAPPASETAAEAAALLPEGRAPLPGVITGGQPDAAQLAALAEAGYRTVVDLRAPGEPYSREDEKAALESLGVEYVSIPVAGPEGLTEESARALSAVLAEKDAYPIAIHCASGNRVGALLALEAAWVDGAPPAEALALGLDAGLTGLEPKVRGLLGLEQDPR
ncbi:MAG TPA: sulfur transferase domain-containing protein [Thermoanaerobaculia bacterium]|nr:sulfur transferase domain-containing protein [Thermoanaerobaculia bacterium]